MYTPRNTVPGANARFGDRLRATAQLYEQSSEFGQLR